MKRPTLKLRDPNRTRPIEVMPSLTGPVDPGKLQFRDEFAEAIRDEWGAAQKSFLRIGAMLDRASSALPADEYAALCEGLPFGKAVRSQLMTAFRAIRSGRVPEEVAAAGYTTVHLLAGLDDEQMADARDAGLLRPDVTRAEIRARFGRPNSKAAPQPDERARLLARRRELLAELVAVRRALRGLCG